MSTVRAAWIEILVLVRVPRDDRHEIGHERRHLTLQYGGVASDRVLLVHVRVVVLVYD